MMKTEPDPLPNIKGHLTVFAVIVQFVPLLCLEEVVAHILKKCIAVSDQVLNCWDTGLTGLICAHGRRVTAIDKTKWSIAKCRVVRSVIAIFSPWQPPDPLLGTVSCDAAKIRSNDFVYHLGLTI